MHISDKGELAIRRALMSLTGQVEHKNAPTYPDPVAFIESEFKISETKAPLLLAPYQRSTLYEALRTDELGLLVYDLILWSDIKKSAKSTIAAAVVLWRALTTENGRFRIVANDQKQAASRVFDAIVTCLSLNEKLGARFAQNRYLLQCDNGSKIEAVPVDPKGEAGGGDDMIEWTELHAAESKAASLMWAEMTLSPLKFGKSQTWIDTYAGHSGESPILEPLYTSVVKEGKQLSLPDAPTGLEVYANGRSFALWNTVPRLPWQTPEYYASEASRHTASEMLRIHHNQWVSSTQQFVPIEWWDHCELSPLPALDHYKELIVALDAAVSNDCFGIVAVSRSGDKIIVRYARKWSAPANSKLLFTNYADRTDTEYPEGEIRRLAKDYNVISFVYDPYQLESFCAEMRAEGLGLFDAINQGKPRLVADKMLYDCIRDRRVLHSGELDLRDHISNANSTAEEKDSLRIVKRADHLKIDLAVALSMATAKALEILPE